MPPAYTTRIVSKLVVTICLTLLFSFLWLLSKHSLVYALPPQLEGKVKASELSFFRVDPQRVVWTSGDGVKNPERLLSVERGQAVLKESGPVATLKPGSSVVLDFGIEINGVIEIITPITPLKDPLQLRIRFGESVSETMAELGEKGAQNDHALRDQKVTLPWLGKISIGPSGFRFVRIDNIESKQEIAISEIFAQLIIRDVPYVGSFECSDDRLNKIWQTGAYTVHLNMQEYLWDGIKRDRLVWLGDMHPEVSVINTVFGHNEVVPKSLDMIRDRTPIPEWMNGISSYSMWWVIIHEDWYMHHGNLPYLQSQHTYLAALLKRLATFIGPDGAEKLDGMRFLDWPTFEDKKAVHEGLQAMMLLTMKSGERLAKHLNDSELEKTCSEAVSKLQRHTPQSSGRKSPAALLSLAGLRDASETANTILIPGGPKDLSTFYGFYVLDALAMAKQTNAGLDMVDRYWGGMLDVGATTFWEGFDLDWTLDAGRIDELVPPGKKDIHGDFGEHCYIGFRHSLCHGWAGGPTAWLSRHVLGVQPLTPGCRKLSIDPHLGRLEWAKGTFPTPHGPVSIDVRKLPDGTLQIDCSAPPEVEVVKQPTY
jgi:hypothetical protein